MNLELWGSISRPPGGSSGTGLTLGEEDVEAEDFLLGKVRVFGKSGKGILVFVVHILRFFLFKSLFFHQNYISCRLFMDMSPVRLLQCQRELALWRCRAASRELQKQIQQVHAIPMRPQWREQLQPHLITCSCSSIVYQLS